MKKKLFRGRETKASSVAKGKKDENPRARDRGRVVEEGETECDVVDECDTIEKEKVLRINKLERIEIIFDFIALYSVILAFSS